MNFKYSFFLVFLSLVFIHSALGQSPESFKYQAVARDNAGTVIANQNVGFRMSILQGSTSGSAVYSETHSATTNAFGLVNLEIGSGTVLSGNLSGINWSANSHFIKVEMDATGGSSYQLMGTSQLLSVPYALQAKKAETAVYVENESQILNLSGDTLSISSGNTVILPAGGSGGSDDQTLSLSGDTLSIESGNYVVLPPVTAVSGGKTHLVLSGDISNADAAIKIANDFGPSTQFVVVSNTTQLTSLVLPGVTELLEIQILENEALTSISFPDLESIFTQVYIESNAVLSSFDFPSLSLCRIWGAYSNSSSYSLSLPSLAKCNSLGFGNDGINSLSVPALVFCEDFSMESCDNVATVSLPAVNNSKPTSIYISECQSLSSFSAPLVEESNNISFYQNPSLTSLNLNSLTSAGGLSLNYNNAINSVSFPSLTTTEVGNSISFQSNGALTSIDISSLTSSGTIYVEENSLLSSLNLTGIQTVESFTIYNNTVLPSLNCPNLNTINGNTYISGNYNLSSLSLSSLITYSGNFYVYNNLIATVSHPLLNSMGLDYDISGNQLSSNSINGLLSLFANINPPVNGISIILSGQTPLAPPTGQGVTDKATLIANGNSVFTD